MRKSAYAVIVIICICVAMFSGLLILLPKAPPVEPLPLLSQAENIFVLENGDATLKSSLTVTDPVLAKVYKEAFEYRPIPPVEPVTFTITHTTTDDFLAGTLENLKAENDEVKLGDIEPGYYRPLGKLTSAELFFAPLTSATASWNASFPTGTELMVWLSIDNGVTWEYVDNNVPHKFASSGSVLRYKIVLSTKISKLTPTLYDITITFTRTLPEDKVVHPEQLFIEEVAQQYRIIYGLEATIANLEKTFDNVKNIFALSFDAKIPRAAKFDAGIWKIDIGPREEDRDAAIGYTVTQMMLIQLMLENLLGEQVFTHTSSTPIQLPRGARILNREELLKLAWRVDFGGGTYREASVTVDEALRKVTLREKIVVSERPITVSPEEFLERLAENYRIFTIRYTLGGGSASPEPGSHQPVSGDGSLTLGGGNDNGTKGGSSNWSRTWTRSFSHTFSRTFSWSGTYGGVSASADATISASPSLTAKLHIGWEISPWYRPRLRWFRTYFEVTPSVSASLDASVTAGVTRSWSHTYRVSYTISFWIGPVPVWADLALDVIPSIEASVNATCTLNMTVGASATGKFGVEWIRGEGWRGIRELSHNFWRSGPTITGGVDITITPYVELKPGFYLYSVAGPYASVKPLFELGASFPERTWSIKAGFDIYASVTMGGLERWVGLSDWGTTLYGWRTTLWSGRW